MKEIVGEIDIDGILRLLFIGLDFLKEQQTTSIPILLCWNFENSITGRISVLILLFVLIGTVLTTSL